MIPAMTAVPLTRHAHSPAPALTLWDEIALAHGRVHEVCGRARRMLALEAAARAGRPVLWIAPAWADAPLNPCGVAAHCPPQALVFVTPRRPEDLLWSMEEALRSGAVPLVVADLPDPPALTPVRRLQLAAERGGETGQAPLGLILTPGTGGAPGVETRLRAEPEHGPGRSAWRLERLRARMLPPRAWHLDDNRLHPTALAETA